MKILRVISSVNIENGGPINGLVNSSRILEEKGYTVHVAALDDPSAIWVKSFDFTLFSFKGGLGGLQYSTELLNWLNHHVVNYDVVIIHGLWQYHSYATHKACVANNIPYVVFTHGMLDPWFNQVSKLKHIKKYIYWNLFEKYVINQATSVLFTSEEEKLLARKSFPDYSPIEKVVAYGSSLPNIDLTNARTNFLKKFTSIRGRRFALFLSRVHPKKGIDLLIEAYGQLNALPDDFDLVIAGPDHGNIKPDLMKNCPKHIADRIHWVGMLSGALKWGAFHAAECFVLPSHQENFGIVVAEALSTNTPVLITNKVNIWREIDSAKAGFIEPDTVSGIAKLLQNWLALSPSEKLAMNARALNCYQNNFSIESAAGDLEKTLQLLARSAN